MTAGVVCHAHTLYIAGYRVMTNAGVDDGGPIWMIHSFQQPSNAVTGHYRCCHAVLHDTLRCIQVGACCGQQKGKKCAVFHL